MQLAIPFMQFRGGSSKGLYFLADDLPSDPNERDQILLAAVGRDARQIDGLGGAHPLTSKVAVVSRSNRADADVDFLFVQVVVGENRVDTTPNCGNILAGVGPFAVEAGLVAVQGDTTVVRVYMVNSENLCELTIQTPDGRITYEGNATIDGAPNSSAPIICNYLDVAGSICGALLPTGNSQDVIEGVAVTCIDNGMPVVLINAQALGKTGYETCAELTQDQVFRSKLEAIRLQAGRLMNLGDVTKKVVPKMTLIAPPQQGGNISTRTFIPHTCHDAIGVLGAVSVATACLVPHSVAQDVAIIPSGNPKHLSVEHPSGEFSVALEQDAHDHVIKAGLLRTARLLSRGEVYVIV
ncbi:4-oxalomesaconate tautomerase [Thiolinea disciformis]|uniref:4-oxalomesaconate tautomerase n=1 Tax=Thiolinea disciformis TaxID=125614 RepID=UPI000372EF75|nr:4-oxalomesaconate tautomerase [Thiolinea disciformis]